MGGHLIHDCTQIFAGRSTLNLSPTQCGGRVGQLESKEEQVDQGSRGLHLGISIIGFALVAEPQAAAGAKGNLI